MNNPPDKPRDDRRMHEGEKPGLEGEKINRADQEDIIVAHEPAEGHDKPVRDRPSPLEEDVTVRSNA